MGMELKAEKHYTPEEYEKRIYDLQQLLEISKSLCNTYELKTLTESILYAAMAQMRVVGAGIFVYENLDTNVFCLGNNYFGLDVKNSYDYRIPSSSKLIAAMACAEKNSKAFTPIELKSALKEVSERHKEDLDMLLSLNPSLVVPLILNKRINGILVLGERIVTDENSAFTTYEKDQIISIASLASVAVNNASLIEQSSTDLMTHLKLKYYFFNILSDRIDFASSHDHELGVIMFDIDHFKTFNDTYGHACGDYVLLTVAKIIKSSIRGTDLASRYGGEEFTVMLYNANQKESMAIAERIRKKVEDYDFFYKNIHMKVTISGGVSVYSVLGNPVGDAKVLVEQADQALYISKRGGRNKISFANPAVIAASTISGIIS